MDKFVAEGRSKPAQAGPPRFIELRVSASPNFISQWKYSDSSGYCSGAQPSIRLVPSDRPICVAEHIRPSLRVSLGGVRTHLPRELGLNKQKLGGKALGDPDATEARERMSEISDRSSPSCSAVRDRAFVSITAADLVKGDVILIRVGDKTPADLVLFAATDLKIDNSSLAGESEL
ncbi:hypothetical protein DFH09DRAFT_1082173 [Mycena vulgaris]|nr:hypothetical protein DFH09DRAFT_1082173 [Mycena vulgaris]